HQTERVINGVEQDVAKDGVLNQRQEVREASETWGSEQLPVVEADAQRRDHWHHQERQEAQQAGQQEGIGNQLFLAGQGESLAAPVCCGNGRLLAQHLPSWSRKHSRSWLRIGITMNQVRK